MKKTMYRCDGTRCDPTERYCIPMCFMTSDIDHADPAYDPFEIDLNTGVITPGFDAEEALLDELMKPAEQRMPCKRALDGAGFG